MCDLFIGFEWDCRGKGKNELKSFFDLKANKKCLCLISDGDCLTLSAVAATFAQSSF